MKKRNIVILILLLLIGFASITTSLFIRGRIKLGVNTSDFIIKFVRANVDGKNDPNAITANGTMITYSSKVLASTGDESSLVFDVKNSSTQYDAKIELSCNVENFKYADFFSMSKSVPEIIKAGETKTGYIIIKMLKPTLETLVENVTCTINPTPIEKSMNDENSDDNQGNLIVMDKGGNGISLGNKLSLNGEDFYVIGSNDETESVYLLSSLNILKSSFSQEYEQRDAEMNEYRTVFSNSAFWKDTCSYLTVGNNLKVCNLLSDELTEEENIVQFMAYQYGEQFGEGIKGRLMTVDEVLALAPNASKTIRTITGDYANIINGADSKDGSLRYWLDTANDFRSLWAVYGSTASLSSYGFSYGYYFGCRPVLEVPKTLIIKENV